LEILLCGPSSIKLLDQILLNYPEWDKLKADRYTRVDEIGELHGVNVLFSGDAEHLMGFKNKTKIHFGPKWQNGFKPNLVLKLIKEGRFVLGEIFDI
jgi:hypothetical protein